MEEMKTILEANAPNILEKFLMPWYFRTRLDKGFLVLLCILSMYAVVRVIGTGFW